MTAIGMCDTLVTAETHPGTDSEGGSSRQDATSRRVEGARKPDFLPRPLLPHPVRKVWDSPQSLIPPCTAPRGSDDLCRYSGWRCVGKNLGPNTANIAEAMTSLPLLMRHGRPRHPRKAAQSEAAACPDNDRAEIAARHSRHSREGFPRRTCVRSRRVGTSPVAKRRAASETLLRERSLRRRRVSSTGFLRISPDSPTSRTSPKIHGSWSAGTPNSQSKCKANAQLVWRSAPFLVSLHGGVRSNRSRPRRRA